MRLPDFILFASDAAELAMLGAAFVVFAMICMVMDRRRMKRAQINRVGWMPWTGLFLAFMVLGGGMLAVALPGLLAV